MATLAARNLMNGLLDEPLDAGVDLEKYTEDPTKSANL